MTQDRADIEHYVRQEGGQWVQTVLTGLDGDLAIASLQARISVEAIYAGVTFPEQPDI